MNKIRLAKSLAKCNGNTADEELEKIMARKTIIDNFGFDFAFTHVPQNNEKILGGKNNEWGR